MSVKVPEEVAKLAKYLGVTVQDLLRITGTYIKPTGANIDTTELLQSVAIYIKQNPGTFTIQAVGTLVALAAVSANPILGALGFTPIGPAALSQAAAWQASIGAVPAGSVFAWCQGVAMGGSAAAGVTAAGIGGAATAVAPTVLKVVSGVLPAMKDFAGGLWQKAKL